MTKIQKSKTSLIIAAAFVVGIFPVSGLAAPAKCGDRGDLVKILKQRYKEERVAIGLSQKSTEAFEIFASDEGTWTVMMTLSTGQTCIMAAGHSWEQIAIKANGPVT